MIFRHRALYCCCKPPGRCTRWECPRLCFHHAHKLLLLSAYSYAPPQGFSYYCCSLQQQWLLTENDVATTTFIYGIPQKPYTRLLVHHGASPRHALRQYSGANYHDHSCLQRVRSQIRYFPFSLPEENGNMKSVGFEPTTHRLLVILCYPLDHLFT